MPIGSSKLGVLGAGLVPGGTETFNAPGTFSIPPGVKKVSITGVGGTGNPGTSGTAGMLGIHHPGLPLDKCQRSEGANIAAGPCGHFPALVGGMKQFHCASIPAWKYWHSGSVAGQAGSAGCAGNPGQVIVRAR
jgi:hypothetical protein